MLLICSEDDTVDQEDYLKLQQQQQQQQRQQLGLDDSNNPTTRPTKEDDDDEEEESDHKGRRPQSIRVVILSDGAGHGPFFGPSSTTYFRHIHQFLHDSTRTAC